MSELVQYFALATAILVLTSIIFTLFDLIPAITRSGVTTKYAAAYLCYLTPQIVYFVTPFALLLAILTSYNVLSRSNQITALYASGQSTLRLGLPILMGTVFVISSLFLLSENILPQANREQDTRYHKIKGRKLEQATLAFGQKWVYGLNDSIYSYQFRDRDNHLLNTTVYRLDPTSSLLREVFYVGEASLTATPNAWQVLSGWNYVIRDNLTIQFQPLPAKSNLLEIQDGPGIFKRTVNESTKMSYTELSAYLNHLKRIGAPTTELRIDLEKKRAFPFSCLTLAILALPFSLSNNRKGTLAGVSLSIIISLAFWSATTLFEVAGKRALLPTWMAAWGAQVLFLALGTYLFFTRRV